MRLMLACSFLTGTAAYALFLSQFDAQDLPYCTPNCRRDSCQIASVGC